MPAVEMHHPHLLELGTGYPTEAFAFDPIRDLKELITHYRPYVSLATYCMGNEGNLGRSLGNPPAECRD